MIMGTIRPGGMHFMDVGLHIPYKLHDYMWSHVMGYFPQ